MRHRDRVILFLVVLSVLRLIYVAWTPFDLSPDEAHYWEWSRRLDLSYYSKGPLVAYVIAFFTSIFGDNDLGVRAGAVVFSALGSYLIYVFGRGAFGSERVGMYAAVLPNLTPIFSIGSILMTTDVLFIFFWAAALCAIQRALGEGQGRGGWWYLTGALVGLGFLAKYTMVLFYPCILLYLLASARHRGWLKRPAPYAGALISLALAMPVIIWNLGNGLVTFKHTMGQVSSGGEAAFSVMPSIEFIGAQAGLLTPLIFISLVYGVYRCFRSGLDEGHWRHRLVFYASAPLFFFFVFKGLHGKVQANWAVASYTAAMPAAVWAFLALYERISHGAKKALSALAATGLALGLAATFIAFFPWTLESFGAKNILWGPPFNRVTEWRALGDKVSEARDTLGPGSFVMSNTYQITSELAFYTRGHPRAFNAFAGSRRLNQYDLWGGLVEVLGRDAVYVTGGDTGLDDVVENAFDTCDKELFEIYHRGRVLKEFSIFRCRNFSGLAAPREVEPSY